ncbi:hypothetical protein C5L22_02790 [Pantoea ananatis]|nr:hypothetical protein C5L22_02790 [Pantoea ananatis]
MPDTTEWKKAKNHVQVNNLSLKRLHELIKLLLKMNWISHGLAEHIRILTDICQRFHTLAYPD